jgi:hypothetical protein
MSGYLKRRIKTLSLGSSAALFVSAGALAALPPNPVLSLSGHTATNAYNSDTGNGVYGLSYGIDGGGATFNANGDLTGLADRAACGATNATCKILDGSGDGMLMYLVTDGAGKKHINQIVGTYTPTDGLFLDESFVEYNGGNVLSIPPTGSNVNSMANKYIIKDADELASAGSGFRLSAEWLRGDYQKTQPSAYEGANANGDDDDDDVNGGGDNVNLDTIVDMNIGHVQSFHMDGTVSQDGAPEIGVIDIQAGTNADNTAADAEDAQAMGQFHTRNQGGNAYFTTNPGIGTLNYNLGSPTITLGTGTLKFGAADGASVTFIHQAGFGFNGSADEDYTVDHSELRDFSYIRAWRTAALPSSNVGTFQDPMRGIYASASLTDGGSLTATSQKGVNEVYVSAPVIGTNTAHAPDFNGVLVTVTANDIMSAGTGGEFTATGEINSTDDLALLFSQIFGISAY